MHKSLTRSGGELSKLHAIDGAIHLRLPYSLAPHWRRAAFLVFLQNHYPSPAILPEERATHVWWSPP